MLDRAVLESMSSALEHRGPDSRGFHLAPGIALGIQRLRIIDLVTGDQPMFNEDRTVAVVFNGEIYNYRELQQDLRRSGHRFVSDSDTEVIVHLYEEMGTACVQRLHGMFGLAIWDVSRQRLMLARDRLGKKPLFYAHRRAGELSFASELGALLRDPTISRELDPAAIDAYLAFRYIPSPLSAFRSVRKLPPAHRLIFESGSVKVERYWRLRYDRKRQFSCEQDATDELREHLRKAVRRRMISDVPLGAFLSGGIDSAAVVAAMAEASTQPVKTFSIGFSTSPLDERPLARTVAERFATDHHELEVEPSAIEVLPRLIRHHGEPFADATSIPTYYLAALTRRHVTVALNGDGGDEAFGGYPRYVAGLLAGRLDRVPSRLRRIAGHMAAGLPADRQIDSWRSRVRRVGATLSMSPSDRHLAYMTDLQGLRRTDLYTDDFRRALGQSSVDDLWRGHWQCGTADDPLDRMLEMDVATYLPDDLLLKVDIATMACSLEGRSPFLDHELMEFAASLPPHLKVAGGVKKVALRRAMRGWLPDAILDAPKRGFQPPVADWFRGPLREHSREVLLDGTARSRPYFRPYAVEKLLREHASGADDHSQGLWTLLVLEVWHREVVDRPVAGPPSLA